MKDHADLRPAQKAQLGFGQVVHASSAPEHFACGDTAAAWQQTEQRRAERTLAAARLAEHAERASGFQGEAHATDRDDVAGVFDVQIADFEKRIHLINPSAEAIRRR